MLMRFLPQFCMTFFICLFILMMQFLFRYINDLVGKGLDMATLGELFFYAACSMVPMALPLAILLASLMTFGNLGEHVELTALKSSGISLITVMKPLIVLIAFIAVGAFFFQNDVLPKTQVQMWTLLFSAREKSASLSITPGEINTDIPGFNVYVKRKDKATDMLYNVIIYDVSSASNYPRIVTADSAKLNYTQDKKHILLKLYHGNWYEDLGQGGSAGASFGSDMFRRETYHDKVILIPYDATFTKMDDNTMRSQYIGKNIDQLNHSIDSLQSKCDSVGDDIGRQLQMDPVCGVQSKRMVIKDNRPVLEKVHEPAVKHNLDIDSLFDSLSDQDRYSMASIALQQANSAMMNADFKAFTMADDAKNMRRHQIELQRKFTLSLACFIFFFLGAPLGAIIRKGGLGMPVVISVLLFIFYYIIDNTGYKMGRDGRWPVWQGIWLSSAVLMPLGAFLTYKAVNDSAVFNPDAWRNFFRRITGLHVTRKLEMKEVIINEVDLAVATEKLEGLKHSCSQFLSRYASRQSYLQYLMYGYDKKAMRSLSAQVEDVVDYLSNSREQLVINKAMDFPVLRHLLSYHITNYPKVGLALAIVFPVGLVMYLVGIRHQLNLKRDIATCIKVANQVEAIFNGTDDRHQSN